MLRGTALITMINCKTRSHLTPLLARFDFQRERFEEILFPFFGKLYLEEFFLSKIVSSTCLFKSSSNELRRRDIGTFQIRHRTKESLVSFHEEKCIYRNIAMAALQRCSSFFLLLTLRTAVKLLFADETRINKRRNGGVVEIGGCGVEIHWILLFERELRGFGEAGHRSRQLSLGRSFADKMEGLITSRGCEIRRKHIYIFLRCLKIKIIAIGSINYN